MTGTPFPCSGKLYNLNGTSVVNEGVVGIFNFTKGTETHCKTNSAGEYTLDLIELGGTTPYAENDVLYLYASYPGKNAVIRAVLASGDDKWEDQNIFLKTGEFKVDLSDNTCKERPRLISVSAGMKSSASVFFIEKESDIPKVVLEVNAGMDASRVLSKPGVDMNQGFWILRLPKGMALDDQTAGVSYPLGDTVLNKNTFITAVY